MQRSSQLVETVSNGLQLAKPFRDVAVCDRLPRVAPALLRKCSVRRGSVPPDVVAGAARFSAR
jgi:hypothetical protein